MKFFLILVIICTNFNKVFNQINQNFHYGITQNSQNFYSKHWENSHNQQIQSYILDNVGNQKVLNSNQGNQEQILHYQNPITIYTYTIPNNVPTNQNIIQLQEESDFLKDKDTNNIKNPTTIIRAQGRSLSAPFSNDFVKPVQNFNKKEPLVENRNSLNDYKDELKKDNISQINENLKKSQTSPETFEYQFSKGWSVHEAISVDDIVLPHLEDRKYSNYSTPNKPDAEYYQKFFNIYNYVENQGKLDLSQSEMESINDDFNGRSIVAPGQYPHMAAIGFLSNEEKIEFKCGGSLISKMFVITAAHCCSVSGETPIIVKLGIINLKNQTGNSDPQRRAIKEIIIHPSYNSTMNYHDIALLKLQSPVEFTKFVRPILLWSSNDIPYERVFTMGYGSTSFAKAPTNILTELSLSLIPWQKCKETIPKDDKSPLGIVETQICGRDLEKHRDTCQGDSGGPLQLNLEHRNERNTYRYYLVGIISFGEFCGSTHPGVYTRVSSYCKWIASIVWPDYFKGFQN